MSLPRAREFVGRLGIRGRLGGAFVLLSTLPALLVGLYRLDVYLGTLETLALEHVDGSIVLLKERLDAFLYLAERDLRSLRESSFFEDYLRSLRQSGAATRADREAVGKAFLSYVQDKPPYHRLRFLDRHGDEIIKIRRAAGGYEEAPAQDLEVGVGAYFLHAIEEQGSSDRLLVFPGEILAEPHGGQVIQVITLLLPVSGERGDLRGLLGLEVLAQEYFRILERSGLPQLGTVAVADREGHYLYHSRYAKDWNLLLASRGSDNVQGHYPRPVASRILWGQAGRISGGEEIMSFVPLRVGSDTPYVLFYAVPREILFSSMHAFRRLFAGLLLATALAAGLLAVLAAKHFTDPIRALRSGAAALASGDFSHRIVLRTGDEVEELAGGFNAMAEALQEREATLQTDITARRAAERAFRASEERLRAVVTSAPVVLWALDRDGAFTLSEGRGLASLGLTPSELVGRSVFEVYRDSPEILENTRRALAGETLAAEVAVGGVTFDSHYAPLRGGNGDVVGVIGVATDITERKRAEDQFRQSQKMEAIGRLAGGIAHDFNNLLSVMIGYSDLLLRQCGEGSPLRRKLGEIRKAGDRAASLTRQLLAFSRKQVLVPEVLDLGAVVTDLVKMLRRLIGEDITLMTVLHAEAGKVKADRGQLEQVIMNLVVNARDAMPRGGKLIIEAQNTELDESYARGHPGVEPGPHVMLAVTDTGIGMDEETRSRIFEPFFTTKEKGKGTGLGLATVYGIVKQSGGSIWVYSEPGKGTTFKLYLPRVEDAAMEASPPHLEGLPEGGSETVLLVEDENMLRRMAREILETSGYQVLDAGGGEEALRLVRGHEGPIHLLLTDVVMPGMGGREVAERLTRSNPALKVLYMSGYTDDAIVHQGVLAEGIAFIQKPVTPGALTRKIRQVLDRKE